MQGLLYALTMGRQEKAACLGQLQPGNGLRARCPQDPVGVLLYPAGFRLLSHLFWRILLSSLGLFLSFLWPGTESHVP